MSSFVIKMTGIITMLIDHIGMIYLPQVILLRVIGRIAFPIFAFLISEGYRKTSDIKRYTGRLLIFAIISQIAFSLAMGQDDVLNVLFTFALALMAIYIYEEKGSILIVFMTALAAGLLHAEYGPYGVLLVFVFHLYHDDFKKLVHYVSLLTVSYVFINIGPSYVYVFKDYHLLLKYCIQLFSLLSLFFIYFYNGKRGLRVKYLFYIFYPGHLLLLHYLHDYGLIDRLAAILCP